MADIIFQDGRRAAMEQVRDYFEYLFRMEQSGDPFPVDLDVVWPFAYSSKSNAKKALLKLTGFYEEEDYHIFQLEDVVKRPQGGGSQREKVLLTVPCFEYFIARQVRPIFELYRQCRIAVTRAAQARAVMPYHIRRYLANHDQVPMGYFSMLQEVTLKLFVGKARLTASTGFAHKPTRLRLFMGIRSDWEA
jgi:hypothetical protein